MCVRLKANETMERCSYYVDGWVLVVGCSLVDRPRRFDCSGFGSEDETGGRRKEIFAKIWQEILNTG